MADFHPTPEQNLICEAVGRGENTMVEALAGCAKSTTIVMATSQIPANKTVLILAFNVKIKKEMEAKVKHLPNVKVMTMNGLGHLGLIKALRKIEVDNDKIFTLAKEIGLRGDDFTDLLQLTRHARMAGVIPKGFVGKPLLPDTDETWTDLCDDLDINPVLAAPARDVLTKSIRAALAGTIDFDDQIYLPTMLGYSLPQFDVVFVDEAQDLSPMNHLQVKKAARGQIIAVGDSHQAIYAWRGADSNSMENLKCLRSNWTELTLSTTFRCPRKVVERQQKFVPLFTAGPENLDGSISILREWMPDGGSSAAVLCRNNAPLLRLAFQLLANRIPCQVLGRDIGKQMKRLYNKLSAHGKHSIAHVMETCRERIEAEPEKSDKFDSLLAMLEGCDSIDQATRFLDESSKNSISLSTGHRAKGLEWDTVYHLEPGLIPSRWVREMPEGPKRDSALQQENNLRYVIETRTRNHLNFVRLENLAL